MKNKTITALEEYNNAILLIQEYFPEAKSQLRLNCGFDIYRFLDCMTKGDYGHDLTKSDSNESPFPSTQIDYDIFQYETAEVFEKLFEILDYRPTGEIVFIPDALGLIHENDKRILSNEFTPVIGNLDTVIEAIDNDDKWWFADFGYDSIFVFESGEVIAFDHDGCMYWSKSKLKT